MKIIQSIKKRAFIFLLSQVFFTAGWSKKLKIHDCIEDSKKNHNLNLLEKFDIISNGLKLIYEKKFFNFDQIIKNHDLKKFLIFIGQTSVKNFEKNFLKEFHHLNELIYAFNSMNLFYIDNYNSLLIEDKTQNKSCKNIIIFHCGGRDGLTIKNEDYFLEFSFKINSNFKNCNIKHIWLNMPKKPFSSDEIAAFQFQIIKNIIYVKKYKLENIILCGFSMGGIISLKILEKIKNDKFFANQKLLAYINIASFFNMINVLKSLKPTNKNQFIPCKILNSLGFITSKSFDEKFLSNWSVDFEKIFPKIEFLAQNHFICSLEFDEFVPNECSLLNKISEKNNFDKIEYNSSGIKTNQQNSIFYIKIDNKNKLAFNHESSRDFFLNFILDKLINQDKFNTTKDQNLGSKLLIDLIKFKYIKNIVKT